MTRSGFDRFSLCGKLLILSVAFAALGCGFPAGTPPNAVVGRIGRYDYSPTAIQSGDVQQFWWCGEGSNPNKHSQTTDVILYQSINTVTKAVVGPLTVLGEGPDKWDSIFICNPKVIRGTFTNPLSNGQTYTYAMYYVGTSALDGTHNYIGVAFSNDGITWDKYPDPIIVTTSEKGYGIAQPAVYNSDGKSGIWLFYEDDETTIHHTKVISSDGVHFIKQGDLTLNGLNPQNKQPSWGDMAYDSKTGYWYAAYNLPLRNSSSAGGAIERGQYGFEVFRIPDASLLTGVTPWQQMMTVDTNLTGNESNFIPGFLRDMYGNLNIGSYPSIQMYTSFSNPKPAWNASARDAGSSGDTSKWDIGSAVLVPDQTTVAFNQYFNGSQHETTTGWIDPAGKFQLEAQIGHLFLGSREGATVPFFSCKRGTTEYFVTLDNTCGGDHYQGSNGYGYAAPVAGLTLVAIYSCHKGQDHLLSRDPNCEGNTPEGLLGYVLP